LNFWADIDIFNIKFLIKKNPYRKFLINWPSIWGDIAEKRKMRFFSLHRLIGLKISHESLLAFLM